MPLITKPQLARVASRALPHVVNAIVDHADDVLPRYGIITPLRIQHFMAQVLVETGYLRNLTENLSYTAARLCQVFPSRFRTLAQAEPYANRPERLAALVYGHRMGNVTDADAWANRGQGLLQDTGHDNIAAVADDLHVSVDQARGMLTSDSWMLECAAATFVRLGCIALADRDDVAGVTHAITGGNTALEDRAAALKLCRRVWPPIAVIKPTALIPQPLTLENKPVQPADAARIAAALEKVAASPQTAILTERVVTGALKGVSAAPATGWLAGKKTYIVAALGVIGTVATVALAMEQNGGLSWTGWFAAINALVLSGGFATGRAALASHFGEIAGLMLDVGQNVALEVIKGHLADAGEQPAAG